MGFMMGPKFVHECRRPITKTPNLTVYKLKDLTWKHIKKISVWLKAIWLYIIAKRVDYFGLASFCLLVFKWDYHRYFPSKKKFSFQIDSHNSWDNSWNKRNPCHGGWFRAKIYRLHSVTPTICPWFTKFSILVVE